VGAEQPERTRELAVVGGDERDLAAQLVGEVVEDRPAARVSESLSPR
jgi:hypothetical protein